MIHDQFSIVMSKIKLIDNKHYLKFKWRVKHLLIKIGMNYLELVKYRIIQKTPKNILKTLLKIH